MPIVIKTTEQSCGNRMTHPPVPLWLQQSLARFMSNHKGRIYTCLQYEDSHNPGNPLSNTMTVGEENSAVTFYSSAPISRLKYEKMLRNLENIRLKSDKTFNNSLIENAGLIMLATQSNLIGLSTIPSRDSHPYDRSMHKVHIGDKSNIHTSKEPEAVLQGISIRSENEVQGGSLLKTGLVQVIKDLHPAKLLNPSPNSPFDHRDTFRKKNFRYPDIFHFFQSKNGYAGNPSFHNILYTFCATLAARLSTMDTAFRKYLESVPHYWRQFIRFLEPTSFSGGNVIYLLSRTTMRRVKFLYEKPPTTLSV